MQHTEVVPPNFLVQKVISFLLFHATRDSHDCFRLSTPWELVDEQLESSLLPLRFRERIFN